MGNDPLLAALDQMASVPRTEPKISQVILAAPDIDAVEFGKIAARITPLARGMHAYPLSSGRRALR